MSNAPRASIAAQASQDSGALVDMKDAKLTAKRNLVLFNYGIMHDFFAYSGMNTQYTHKFIDMSKPLAPAGIRGGSTPQVSFDQMAPQPCNMFAIAKIGLPNLVFPNSLDIKFSNFENFDSYMNICDFYFPENSKVQQTVIILRPMIVKNGLNELFVQILRANEFMIIKRKIRPLNKAETAYLFRAEKIKKENSKMYYDIMMSGPCEIIVVSKIAAVYDAKTLFNGANPYGRRRVAQINEDTDSIRSNVDSINAMFEIAPFTSFGEFIDLEDFMVRNSNIRKYKKLSKHKKATAYNK